MRSVASITSPSVSEGILPFSRSGGRGDPGSQLVPLGDERVPARGRARRDPLGGVGHAPVARARQQVSLREALVITQAQRGDGSNRVSVPELGHEKPGQVPPGMEQEAQSDLPGSGSLSVTGMPPTAFRAFRSLTMAYGDCGSLTGG